MLIKSVICVNLWLNVVVNEGEKIGAHFVRQNYFFPYPHLTPMAA